MKIHAPLFLASLALCATSPSFAAPVQPSVGYYNVIAYYKSVTASGGATCPTVGTYANYAFYYPGPGKKGAVAHGSGLASGNFAVGRILFSETPAAGASEWKGSTASVTSEGASAKAVFTATFTYFDSSSFLIDATWNETEGGGGTCDDIIAFSYVKV